MTANTQRIGELLLQKNQTLATAESCTGGLLSSRLTSVAGSSDWFVGGWVTYSNQMKMSQLGVAEGFINTHGAVSWQVARAMCEGAALNSGASMSLSTTGIAGPSGGTDTKPVGTVCIGCHLGGQTSVREFRFKGNREAIREATVSAAIQIASLQLNGDEDQSLEFQIGAIIR